MYFKRYVFCFFHVIGKIILTNRTNVRIILSLTVNEEYKAQKWLK